MNNKVIMVVDDEADTLTLLEATLKQHGFVVMKAQSAGLALHLVQSLTPNLFVVDVTIPGMDGIQLTRKLRANPSTAKTPVIVFSAQNTTRDQRDALDAGANAFLPKTTLLRSLVPEILSLLNQSNGRRSQAHS
jgi:DNA-binding response OmpR family regulator